MKCNILNDADHHKAIKYLLNNMEDYMIDDPFLFQT